MRLYRPVGEKEYQLVKEGGFKAFPPRLPEQPIFYPVLSWEYAAEIASQWNTADKNSGYKGYVLTFSVDDEFISRYPIRTVGAARPSGAVGSRRRAGGIQPVHHRLDRGDRQI